MGGYSFSSHHNLNNLVAIIDYNKIQSLDTTENTLALEPFADKFKAFGWNVIELDGHNHVDLKNALNIANKELTNPTVLICHTTKGKGVSLWKIRFCGITDLHKEMNMNQPKKNFKKILVI